MLKRSIPLAIMLLASAQAESAEISTPLQVDFIGKPAIHLHCDRSSPPSFDIVMDKSFTAFVEDPDIVTLVQKGDDAFVLHGFAFRHLDGTFEILGHIGTNRDVGDFADMIRAPDMPEIVIMASNQDVRLQATITRNDADQLIRQFDSDCL